MSNSTKIEQPTTVRHWLWLAFSRHALVPLLVVELVLILIYVLSVNVVTERNTNFLRQTAIDELQFSSNRYAAYLESRLLGVTNGLDVYVDEVTRAFSDDAYQPPLNELERRQFSPENIYHTHYDNGNAATFYPLPRNGETHDLKRAHKLIAVDGLMKSLVERNSLTTQVYFTDAGSFNHIYPYIDVINQYPPDAEATQFSFFYIGDPVNNPERQLRWTEVYVDPAGQGWMTTASKPVYVADRFEGVASFDIAIKTLIAEVEQIRLPWDGYAMLVDEYLNIVALSPSGATDLGLEALPTDVSEGRVYELIRQDERYNLRSHQGFELLSAALEKTSGALRTSYQDMQLMVGWQIVPGPNWKLITIVNESALFAQTNALNRELNQVIYLMVTGLVLFYITFFCFIWWRTEKLSAVLEAAIEGSKARLKNIQQHDYRVSTDRPSSLIEFNDLADSLDRMATVLNNYVQRISSDEKLLRQALKTSGDIVVEINSEQGLVFGTNRLMELLGFASGDDSETLQTLLALAHQDDRAEMEYHIRHAVDDGITYDKEVRVRRADGNDCWLQVRGIGVLDESTGVGKVVATLSNIDERKRAELHLQQAKQAADQANRSKTLFLSSVTHELRTPLSAIIGFTQIAELGDLAEFQQTALAQIKQASEHLRNLVDDILTHSEIEANELALVLQPTDINHSITEALQVVQSTAAELAVELHYVEQSAPLVVADSRRLQQILINLLSNAVKYNRLNGSVYINSESNDDFVFVNIRDQGRGIAEENLERIFDPFVRLGKEASAIQGTGIGLTISRDLALRMGGYISVSSSLDEGSIFTIALVRAEVQSA